LVADFASGEYDRVPSFFVNLLPEISLFVPERTIVYCTDLHALRLDSLMGKLEESALLDNVRVVHAKLETMDEKANLRPDMIKYLENSPNTMIQLDHHLKEQKFIPQETFDVGILNNDVVGYLHEYYKEYSDAAVSLQKVHKVLKKGALLVVANPCSLYVVDNVQILESLGFEYLEGKDIDLADGSAIAFDRHTEPQSMSRLGHYSFLIFVRK
jgi:SAM-dependent methyltransferase